MLRWIQMRAPSSIQCTRYLALCLHQVLAWQPVCLRQSPSCVTHFAQRVLSTWESQVGTQPELLSTASGNPGRPGPGLSPPPDFPSQWPIHRLKCSLNLLDGLSVLSDRQTPLTLPFFWLLLLHILRPDIVVLWPDSACCNPKSVPVSKERAGENLFLSAAFCVPKTTQRTAHRILFLSRARASQSTSRFPFPFAITPPTHTKGQTKEAKQEREPYWKK
ncbi:hypothetical protein CI102_12923 [Trichoderma harzianum]|nr:hypothetical protein CI102_12923 [Trichoderma harzianum]